MKRILIYTAVIALAFLGNGCASIVDFGKKSVSIKTNPPGATVTITDKKGETVFSEMTPAVVKLKRGGFYSTARYNLHIEAAGYYPLDLKVHSTINPWYFGNIIFGGVLGLLIVDPSTGAMWTISPRHVEWNLVPNSPSLTPEELKAAELKLNPPPSVVKPVKSYK